MMADLVMGLMKIARRLADEGSDDEEASVRRSISTAYYALFHALAEHCANALAGRDGPAIAYETVYRSLDHGATKRFFAAQRTMSGPGALAEIGHVFIRLQEERHSADYDPNGLFYPSLALEFIEQASQAISLVRGLPPGQGKNLAAQLVARRQR